MHNSVVYFVCERIEKLGADVKKLTLEIRSLRSHCHAKFPLTEYSTFDWQECSDAVGEISEEKYTKHASNRPMAHLVIVPRRIDRRLDIYLLVSYNYAYLLVTRGGSMSSLRGAMGRGGEKFFVIVLPQSVVKNDLIF